MKVVSLSAPTHRPPLLPANIPGTHLLFQKTCVLPRWIPVSTWWLINTDVDSCPKVYESVWRQKNLLQDSNQFCVLNSVVQMASLSGYYTYSSTQYWRADRRVQIIMYWVVFVAVICLSHVQYFSHDISEIFIQSDSLARRPQLFLIKHYVIEIMTWKFVYTYRERCKTGPAHNRCWKWSHFTSKHT
jgi:hypothetical protein